jgi:uncharacterized membrane protein
MKLFNFEGDYIGENKGLLDFFIKTLNGMAYGLFATLLVGTILTTFATYVPLPEEAKKIIIDVASVIKGFMGLGIGIGISMSLKLSGLKLIVASISGGIAVLFPHVYADPSISLTLAGFLRLSSDPLVIYVVVIGTIFIMNTILTKQTPIDIIIVPILGVLAAACFSLVVTKPITIGISYIGKFIILATEATPFVMGLVISVVMGMALTAPISSAAIAISIHLGTNAINAGFNGDEAYILGIAGGAALVGCCANMLGFAVMSRKDNNIGTIISVAIGTSMLQFKNILKKPIIWLPPIIVSAILGPLSTVVFKMTTTSIGAGMGTSGLVGQIETITSMGINARSILSILVLQIVLPIVLVWLIDIIFRKYNLIKKGDLKI